MKTIEAKYTIVICDDGSAQLNRVASLLEQDLIHVKIVSQAEQAFELCTRTQVAILVTDLRFKGGHDGVWLIQKLRQHIATSQMPILVTTLEKNLEKRLETLNLDIDDYVAKPYFAEELAARIGGVLDEIDYIEEFKRSTAHGFVGYLQEMSLIDLIQTLELAKKSGIVSMIRPGGEGQIYVYNGQIIDASWKNFPPFAALMNMISWTWGEFRVALQSVQRDVTIRQSLSEILEKGQTLYHRAQELHRQLPDLDSLWQMNSDNGQPYLKPLQIQYLNMFEAVGSIRQIVDNSDKDDITSMTTIKNLIDLRLLTPAKKQIAEPLKNALKNENDINPYSRIVSFFKKKVQSSNILNQSTELGDPLPFRLHLSKSDLLLIRQKIANFMMLFH
jgi:CheY-like chemotaxis protein